MSCNTRNWVYAGTSNRDKLLFLFPVPASTFSLLITLSESETKADHAAFGDYLLSNNQSQKIKINQPPIFNVHGS